MTRQQLAAVPDSEKDAVDYFFLGSMTFAIDDELSYELMKRAEAMEPEKPYIAYERALHEHRRGDCRSITPTATAETKSNGFGTAKHRCSGSAPAPG